MTINFRHLPLYTNLIWASISMSAPLLHALLGKSLVQMPIFAPRKKKLALPSWICKLPNESSWVIIDFWGCFHSILLFHSTVLCPCCSGSHSEVNGQTEHPLLRLECSWIECYCNFGLFLRVLYICHVLQMHVDQSNHYKDLWWTAQICLCWLMMVDVVIMKK